MKLWQKVFLWTMALVMLAIGAASTVILSNNFDSFINREIDRDVLEHSYQAGSLANKVLYDRLRQDKFLLGDTETRLSIRANLPKKVESGGEYSSELRFCVCTMEGDPVASSVSFPAPPEALTEKILTEPESIHSVVFDTESGQSLLVVGSVLQMEGESWLFYTYRDLSELYRVREGQMQFAQVASIALAAVISLILLLVVFRLLSPLNRVNRAITGIAEGKYSLRLPEKKGSLEFRELSKNINRMAGSVEESMEQIKSVAEGRKRFIDNLSHEMKTPLTSILGFADLLRIKRNVNEKQRRDYAGIIVEEARRLQSLSGKLMELVVMNNTIPDFEEIPLRALFHELQLSTRPLLARQELTLLCTCPELTLRADRELVKSLLHNLIDNAAKASSPGQEILLLCRETEQSIVLSVSDQGIGMDAATVKRATEAFYMADKSRSRKKGSSGLGLALCLRIVEIHGGTLRISSKPQKGTTVYALFPKQPGEKGGRS